MKFLYQLIFLLTLSSSSFVLGYKQTEYVDLYCSEYGTQFETNDGIFGCAGSAVENVHYDIENGYVTKVICDAFEFTGVVCNLKNGLKDGTKGQNTTNVVLKNGETEYVDLYCSKEGKQFETIDGVFGCSSNAYENVHYDIKDGYVTKVTCGDFGHTGVVCSLKNGLKDGTKGKTDFASLLYISQISLVLIIGLLA